MTSQDLTISFERDEGASAVVHSVHVSAPASEVAPPVDAVVSYRFTSDSCPRSPLVLDGYLFGLLNLGLQRTDRIVVRGPVSSKAIRNAHTLAEAWHCWMPDTYRPAEVVAEDVVSEERLLTGRSGLARHGRAIAAFSGGVDATFLALRHAGGLLGQAAYPLRDFVLVQGFDVPLEDGKGFSVLHRRLGPFLDALGAQLHTVQTNIKTVSAQDWQHSFAAQLASVLHQYSGSFEYGLLGSSYPYDRPVISWGSTPATDYLLSGGLMEIVHEGAGYSRTAKVAAIAASPPARSGLTVCWEGPERGQNCGECEKCVRTRLNFAAAGLSEPECFDGPLRRQMVAKLKPSTPGQLTELESILEFARLRRLDDPWVHLLESRIRTLQRNRWLLRTKGALRRRAVSSRLGHAARVALGGSPRM